jgi:hypothetical protein
LAVIEGNVPFLVEGLKKAAPESRIWYDLAKRKLTLYSKEPPCRTQMTLPPRLEMNYMKQLP